MSLPDAQRFFGLGDAVTGIEVRTADLDAADGVERAHRRPARTSRTRCSRLARPEPQPLRGHPPGEDSSTSSSSLLIVLVAAFNIVATLVMVVMEKRRDIAMLKSMGATRRGIAAIFITKGLIIGGVGTVARHRARSRALRAAAPLRDSRCRPGSSTRRPLPVKIYPEYFVLVDGGVAGDLPARDPLSRPAGGAPRARSRPSAMTDAPLIRARGLGKRYGGEKPVEVLRDLDLDVAAGEAVVIVGQSGVGKSTLLHLLGALDTPSTGEVDFDGVDARSARRGRARRVPQSRDRLHLPVPSPAARLHAPSRTR